MLVALAALFWGLSGGIGGILMAEGWDPIVVSFYRGAIGLVFVLVWLVLRPCSNGRAGHGVTVRRTGFQGKSGRGANLRNGSDFNCGYSIECIFEYAKTLVKAVTEEVFL